MYDIVHIYNDINIHSQKVGHTWLCFLLFIYIYKLWYKDYNDDDDVPHYEKQKIKKICFNNNSYY